MIYRKREGMNTQTLALQEEYEQVLAYIEGLPAEVYQRNYEIYQARLKKLDAEIDQHLLAEDIINHYRSNPKELAALRLWFASLVEPDTAHKAHAAMIGDDPLAYAGDWAADPDLILDPEPEPWPSWKRQCTDSGYGDFGPM